MKPPLQARLGAGFRPTRHTLFRSAGRRAVWGPSRKARDRL